MRGLSNFYRLFILPFVIGFVVSCLLFYLTLNWPVNHEFWVRNLANALMAALLWSGNAWIASAIKISWLDRPLLRLFVSFTLTIILTIAIVNVVHVVGILMLRGRFPQPLYATGSGDYWSTIIITLLISAFMHGRGFLLQYRAAIIAQEELKRAHLATRYESLQNQVNPHFLFNSFNVLSNLMHKDVELADTFLQRMTQVYRYVLESQTKEAAPLAQELEMLRHYLYMLEVRFGEGLEVELDVTPAPEEYLAPQSLQMLVENAVKHNVVSRKRPLHIRVSRTEGDWITVVNNRQPKDQSPHSLGIGLANIRDRYRLLAGREVIIRAEQDTFSVSLPVLTAKNIV
ncbi:MAG: histidine kinase [Lewinella sp.]|nr:histidine kinase [Lewinella sp.]